MPTPRPRWKRAARLCIARMAA